MNFYKIVLILEADNEVEAKNLASRLVDENGKYYDIWFKGIEVMGDDEILEFFERAKKEMENE